MTQVPAPARKFTREEQTTLNDLQFRWGRAYRIDFNGHIWSARHLASGDTMRADTDGLLRREIREHYRTVQ